MHIADWRFPVSVAIFIGTVVFGSNTSTSHQIKHAAFACMHIIGMTCIDTTETIFPLIPGLVVLNVFRLGTILHGTHPPSMGVMLHLYEPAINFVQLVLACMTVIHWVPVPLRETYVFCTTAQVIPNMISKFLSPADMISNVDFVFSGAQSYGAQNLLAICSGLHMVFMLGAVSAGRSISNTQLQIFFVYNVLIIRLVSKYMFQLPRHIESLYIIYLCNSGGYPYSTHKATNSDIEKLSKGKWYYTDKQDTHYNRQERPLPFYKGTTDKMVPNEARVTADGGLQFCHVHRRFNKHVVGPHTFYVSDVGTLLAERTWMQVNQAIFQDT